MTRITLILFAIVLIAWVPGLEENSYQKYEKRVGKIASRLWQIETINKRFIEIPAQINYKFSNRNFDKSFYEIYNNDELLGYIFYSSANSCKVGGCSAPEVLKEGIVMYDNYSFACFVSTDLNIIKITVLDYDSEYGYEICSRRWLKQFAQLKNEKYNYGKNIQAISGATVSAQSITNAIWELKQMITELKKENII